MRLSWTGPVGRVGWWAAIVVLGLTGCLPPGSGRPGVGLAPRGDAPVWTSAATSRAREVHPELAKRAYGSLPLLFVENRGQADPAITHYVQGGGASVFFSPTSVTHVLSAPAAEQAPADAGALSTAGSLSMAAGLGQPSLPWGQTRQRWGVQAEMVGADPSVRPRGAALAPTVVSYFKGQESDWKAGLPTSTGLVYQEVWPGIDLLYESAAGHLKSSYLVQPGADPGRIVLAYRGASAVSLGEDGALEVSTPLGSFREEGLVAYQDRDGARVEIAAAFRVEAAPDLDASLVTFDLAPYDPALPLVIDPVVIYSRSIDGPGFDAILSVKIDAAGSAYFVGYTEGLPAGLPVVGPDTSFNGSQDALVGKVNAAGTALAYLGYVGSNGTDQGLAVAVDPAGRAYVLGQTDALPANGGNPNGFPVLGNLDQTYGGNIDAFVARVNAAGTGLEYAGYIGGGGRDDAGRIAVDAAGSAYVIGTTSSTRANGFPWKVGPGTDNFGGSDGFVAKVQSDGQAFVYAGFIGTTVADNLTDVAVDTAGNAYLSGNSRGLNGTRTDSDALLVKLAPTGATFQYAWWGGTKDDIANGVAINAAGDAYVTGQTTSTDFPETVGSTLRGENDAFLSMLNAQMNQFVYSRYIGGDAVDAAFAVAVDGAQNAYVAGSTQSSPAQGFPIFGGPNSTFGGLLEGFIVKVQPAGTGFGYGTYFGGGPNIPGSQLASVAVDQAGNAYAAGLVVTTLDLANQQVGVSGFVGKIGEGPPPPTACAPRPPVAVTTVRSGPGQFTVTVGAGTSAGTPANTLREIHFEVARNAVIDIPQGRTGETGPHTHTLPNRPTQTSFTVRRVGGAFTVPFTVTDDCGPWKTFVGGGSAVP